MAREERIAKRRDALKWFNPFACGGQSGVKKNKELGECPATVGFRLEPEFGAVLFGRASTLGVSVHELARHYVMLVLQETQERSELRDAVTTLHRELTELRTDFSVATEALLTSAGKTSAANSKEWVKQNLRSS